MKIFLVTSMAVAGLATAAFATGAYADDAMPATPGHAATFIATSANSNGNTLAAKPATASPTGTTGPTATMVDARPATASSEAAQPGMPNQEPGAASMQRTAGASSSVWKVGPDSYGFEGSVGGCHFNGDAGPAGYHVQKSC